MSSVVSLRTVKAHLRVDYQDEDALISAYIAAAEAEASDYLNRPLDPWDAEGNPVPRSVEQAILLAIGNYYENREAGSQEAYNVNPTFRRLLNPHRLLMGI